MTKSNPAAGPPTSQNGDSDRVAEIRQRLEAATGRRLAAAAIAHPNGADLRTADLAAHAPDDIAWLLSRLAVVEAERDELRANRSDPVTPQPSSRPSPDRAAEKDRQEWSETEALARFDLRIRSLDQGPDGDYNLCCAPDCDGQALWSVWLHTPEWGPQGGATYVRCHRHAISILQRAYDTALNWRVPPTRQSSLHGGVL